MYTFGKEFWDISLSRIYTRIFTSINKTAISFKNSIFSISILNGRI